MNAVVIAAVIVVISAAVMGAAGRLLQRSDTTPFVILTLLMFLPALFVPRFWRDILLCGGVFLLLWLVGTGFWDKLGWAAGVSVPLYLLARVVPGGASVIAAGLSLIVVWYTLSENLAHHRRLKRAVALDPKERPEGDVEIGGRVRGLQLTPGSIPEVDFGKAAGYRLFAKPKSVREPEHLVLTTPVGDVLIALESIELEGARLVGADEQHKRTLNERFGLRVDGPTPMFQVLDEDTEVYVIGTPTWVRSASNATYRDGPMLPAFGEGSKLHTKPELEVDRETAWSVWLAVCFGVAALSVGIVQVFGL